MKALITPARVGVVVLLSVVAFVWMFGQVVKGIEGDPSGYRVYAFFRDAGGLADKSRVVIAGVVVGQIDTIELEGDRARVWLRVNTPLRSDARIIKRQASFLGEQFLQISPGFTGAPLRDGDQIVHVDYDAAPSDLINELQKISKDVKEITGSLRAVVSSEDGEDRLVAILEDVRQTVAEVRGAMVRNSPKVDRLIETVIEVAEGARALVREFRVDADRVMENVERVSEDARVVSANVRQVVEENTGNVTEGLEGVKGAVARLESALDKLDGTMESARSIAGKIDEGQGTIGRLVNDDRLVNSVNELVDETSIFLRQLTRLQTIVAMRSEYYLGQGQVKNYLTVKLQPRPDKYYLFQLVDDPRGRTIFRDRVVTSTASDSDPTYRERESITEDRFRLSLQFAKRFYFVTGRVGIIESSGGIGADFHLFSDDLMLTADLYQFSTELNPRLRMQGTYTFFTHLFIAAGIDEVFNEDRTDFFIGAGVEFNDEDLRAILMTTSPPSLD